MERRPSSYRDSGVDIDAQDRALARVKELLRRTRTPGVLSDLGTFGGLFALEPGIASPVLVASCDGVGTKLRLAFETGIHRTVGRDLVNHCVNDILVQGARPLFFLDYVATGRLAPEVVVEIVAGIARGCEEAGCALLGGETAEMPGFYRDGEYDVAGFIVGVVPRERLLDGSRIRTDDVLIGLASAGLHTNGYSLARRVLFEIAKLAVTDPLPGHGRTVGEVLLDEHRSYLAPLAEPLAQGSIHGLAHVTGGGLTDNVPRILPAGTAARIERAAWPVPALFDYIREVGNVDRQEMYRVFNMGVGMVAVVPPDRAAEIEEHLRRMGQPAWRIGTIVPGDRRVVYA
jgi:phosphoribosylformylglycinamidine cyclo-ligase